MPGFWFDFSLIKWYNYYVVYTKPLSSYEGGEGWIEVKKWPRRGRIIKFLVSLLTRTMMERLLAILGPLVKEEGHGTESGLSQQGLILRQEEGLGE